MGSVTLFFIALLGLIFGIAWLASKFSAIKEDQELLKNRLRQLEILVEKLSRPPTQPPVKEQPVSEAVAAAAKDRFRNLEQRADNLSPSGPVQEPAAPPVIPSAPPPVPVAPAPEPSAPVRSRPTLPSINWEQFMGVKLIAWVGGLALFLFVALGLKYSFERNLIPPPVRAGSGFVLGVALVIGGVLLSRRKFAVLSQTLCATGVVSLYAVTYVCHDVYRFPLFSTVPSFVLMALITATAFTLAVRMDAMVVAILGMLGGFLTPILVSTGQDNPGALFGYIALLDAGLLGVILLRRWNYLVLLTAVATVLMQVGWVARFFEPEKIHVAQVVFLGFCALFLAAFYLAHRRGQTGNWFAAAALVLPAAALMFSFYLLSVRDVASQPGALFAIVFGADLCVLALAFLEPRLFLAQLVAGMAIFALLGLWIGIYVDNSLLYWALGLAIFFAALHAYFPIVLRHARPGISPAPWAQLFPVIALIVIMVPLAKVPDITLWVWPCVALIDVLAIGVAVLTGSLAAIIGVLVFTLLSAVLWMFNIPAAGLDDLPAMLAVVGGFALFFFVGSLFAAKRLVEKSATGNKQLDEVRAQLPAASAISPFLLLVLIMVRVPLSSPTPIFAVATLLVVLLLGLARVFALDWIPAAGLAGVLALEHVWHFHGYFGGDQTTVSLGWYLFFYALFTAFPFVFWKRLSERRAPWAIAALAGPLHFYLIHDFVKLWFPAFPIGLVPTAFAIPALAGVWFLVCKIAPSNPNRVSQLAWLAGSSLFFITLIFPVQFEKQWITLGWALEGAALLWLFHRVPHPGLRATGTCLLAIAFIRLVLNPAVIHYHARSGMPILNWYLYTYGIAAVCMLVGARLLARPRNWIRNFNTPPLLYTLGVILIFLLVNIEIADYFSEGSTLTFDFSGNLARDMTYTIAWSIFAFGLLILGIVKSVRAIRYASLGLMAVAILKLFFHDLASLGPLYRLGALFSVAVIALLAAFAYQKFFNVKSAK